MKVLGALEALCSSGRLRGPLLQEVCFGGSRFLSADGGAPDVRLLLEVDGPSHFVTVVDGGPPHPESSGEKRPLVLAAKEAAAAAGAPENQERGALLLFKERLDGPSVFKSFALQLLGWRVVRLSYRQWEEASDKGALLRGLLGLALNMPLQGKAPEP